MAGVLTVQTPLAFGDIVVGASSVEMTSELENTGDATVTFTLFDEDFGPDYAVVDSGEATLEPAEIRTLDVIFSPTVLGLQIGEFDIAWNGGAGEFDSPVELTGTGTGVEIIVNGPLGFADREIGTGPSATMQAIITAGDDFPLEILTLAVNGDAGDFNLEGDTGETTILAGQSRTLDFSFEPTLAGVRGINVDITSDAVNNGGVAAIALTGTGLEPPPPGPRVGRDGGPASWNLNNPAGPGP